MEPNTQVFWLFRHKDTSGFSGTGVVADGAVFPDGTTVLRWREVEGARYESGVRATTVIFPNVEAVEAIHGHGGNSELIFY